MASPGFPTGCGNARRSPAGWLLGRKQQLATTNHVYLDAGGRGEIRSFRVLKHGPLSSDPRSV